MHIEAVKEMTRSILAHQATDKQLSFRAGVDETDGALKLEVWWKKGASLGMFRKGLLKSLEGKIKAYQEKRSSAPITEWKNLPRINSLRDSRKNGGLAIAVISDRPNIWDKVKHLEDAEKAIRAVREEFNDVLGETKSTSA